MSNYMSNNTDNTHLTRKYSLLTSMKERGTSTE